MKVHILNGQPSYILIAQYVSRLDEELKIDSVTSLSGRHERPNETKNNVFVVFLGY